MDVWLPSTVTPQVRIGQKSIAGETVLARLPQVAAKRGKERQRHDIWQVRLALKKIKSTRFRSVSINWLLPNMLTIAGLISGLTGLRFALDDQWIASLR